jgi:uncharacterized membrane protein
MTRSTSSNGRRYVLPLLLAYPLLAIAGAVTHWPIYPLLALALLLTVIMLPQLLTRRLAPWLAWACMQGALLALSVAGLATLALQAVPVLVNALLAWWFGRSLLTSTPLVARFITAVEGAERLQQPGVAGYARGLTWFWTVLLATQALVMCLLLVFAEHIGLLVRFGIASPLPIPERLAALWLHVGSYLLLGAVLVLEYGYRLWHLRHLNHPGLHKIMLKISSNWPQLLRGKDTEA